MLFRSAIYVRVACRQRDNSAVAAQQESLERYCTRHGLTVTRRYCDWSGTAPVTVSLSRDGIVTMGLQVCFHWINDLLVADFCGPLAWAGSINCSFPPRTASAGTCASC